MTSIGCGVASLRSSDRLRAETVIGFAGFSDRLRPDLVIDFTGIRTILDRLVNRAHRIELKGPSLRRKRGGDDE